MNGPDVVYDIVAQLRPFVLSRKLFEALAIRLYLHKSISSFHGASIDFPFLPPLPFFSAHFSRRRNKELQITRLRLRETSTSIARNSMSSIKGERSTRSSINTRIKITFLRRKGELCFPRDGKVRLRDYSQNCNFIIVRNFILKFRIEYLYT